MNCPSCGAPMRLIGARYQCDYCKSVYVPGTDDEGVTVLGEGPGELCPICKDVVLSNASLSDAALLFCAKCRGMLISMEVFPNLVQRLRNLQREQADAPPVDPHDLTRSVLCPHCHRAMDAHFYAGPGNVVLDSCETCDLNWLDHGELTQIIRAPEYVQQAMDEDNYAGYDPAASF